MSAVPPTVGSPLVRLEAATVVLRGRPVLREVTWALRPGEHWAVLGGNGAGKSTFLRLVRGDLWPAAGGGRWYALDGAVTPSPIGSRERIGLVSAEDQLRYGRYDEWSLVGRDLVATGLFDTPFLYQTPTPEQWARVDEVMAELGITALADQDIQRMSTGQARKVLIARALVHRPAVLMLDEGCAGLDAPSRRQVLELVDRVARNGTQILFTTHRPDEVPAAVTHVLRLADGVVTAQGPRERIGLDGLATPPTARPAVPPPAPGEVLVEVDADVYVEWQPVLRDLHWRLRAGEHWRVSGPNGSGKSTFLKLLLGELHPALGGRIRRFDLPERAPVWEIRKHLGYVSADLQTRYRDNATVEEVVASGFAASIGLVQPVTAAQQARVDELIVGLGLAPLRGRRLLELSYGQARKALIARALVHRPRVLLLDEALDGLDLHTAAELAAVLEHVAHEGTSLILVSHHDADILPVITHEVILEGGRVVHQGRAR